MEWQLRESKQYLLAQPPLNPILEKNWSSQSQEALMNYEETRKQSTTAGELSSNAISCAPPWTVAEGSLRNSAESESSIHSTMLPALLTYPDGFQSLCWEHQPFVQILIFYTYQGSQPWRTVFLQNFALIPYYSLEATES